MHILAIVVFILHFPFFSVVIFFDWLAILPPQYHAVPQDMKCFDVVLVYNTRFIYFTTTNFTCAKEETISYQEYTMKNRTGSNISANMMSYTVDNSTNVHAEKQGLLPSQVSLSSSTPSSSHVVVSSQSPLRQQQQQSKMDRPIEEGGIDNDTVNNGKSTKPLQSGVLFLNPILPFLILCISIFYIGWYGPRYLMDQYIDSIIERNTPPYQIITLGNTIKERIVILDPTYNHPVVDPPTISCTSFLLFCFMKCLL
jgi:hypothetical protein